MFPLLYRRPTTPPLTSALPLRRYDWSDCFGLNANLDEITGGSAYLKVLLLLVWSTSIAFLLKTLLVDIVKPFVFDFVKPFVFDFVKPFVFDFVNDFVKAFMLDFVKPLILKFAELIDRFMSSLYTGVFAGAKGLNTSFFQIFNSIQDGIIALWPFLTLENMASVFGLAATFIFLPSMIEHISKAVAWVSGAAVATQVDRAIRAVG